MSDQSAPFNFRYPLTKKSNADDYLKITILKYTPPGFQSEPGTFAGQSAGDIINNKLKTNPGDKEIIKGTIILPIPDSIGDTNKVQWGPSTFNPVEIFVGGAVESVVKNGINENTLPNIQQKGKEVLGALGSGTVQRYLSSVAVTGAANALLGQKIDAATVFSRFGGAVTNPNIELIFTGISLRDDFNFTFDMVPRGEKEADQIKNIIRKLKQHSSAKKGRTGENAAGLFITAPEVFKLEYMNGSRPHPFLNKFKICALQGMTVSYTPNGNYGTYYDGTPVNVQLGLSFKELSPIFYEDYNSAEAGTGVGF